MKIDADRVKHWMDHGALPTDRVARFLDEAGITKRRSPQQPDQGPARQEGHRSAPPP